MVCALSQTALKIIQEEKLPERAYKLGQKFRESLASLPKHVVKMCVVKGY